jgi:nitronate monooxygenase
VTLDGSGGEGGTHNPMAPPYEFIARAFVPVINRMGPTKEMIVAAAEAGILGSMPSIKLRSHADFREALGWIRQRTDRPFAINLTIKLTDPERLQQDFEACIEFGVPAVITSDGNPSEIARRAHDRGMVVLHDVIHLRHSLKAQESGADAIIGVAAGAGGHAGTTSPFVLYP